MSKIIYEKDFEIESKPDSTYLWQSPTITPTRVQHRKSTSVRCGHVVSAILLFISLCFILISGTTFVNQIQSCKEPVQRREWRTLSTAEQHDYIAAVQCLGTHGSRMGLNHSIYDDFVWVHSRLGNFSHNTPAFIAWHRYFLHIYETTLRETCSYRGHLTYWDWSLDWEDMAASPIWDINSGFGGTGDKSSNKSVGHGHCVTDGPFANWTVLYFGTESTAHCLSRGFIHGERLEKTFGSKVKPEALENVLHQDQYGEFNLKLEEGPHNAIPRAIRGDFLRVTAPNDPVFFLHHTQLDRLWWQWQTRHSSSLRGSREDDWVNEQFLFEGFAQDVKMSEVMNTESDLLCYSY